MKFLKFRRKTFKNVDDFPEHSLHRTLSVKDLTFLGIAAIIGAGIFSTIGFASFHGGPAVSILFIIIAITCGFSALCYAEFASRVPHSGSAYTYAYVSFGEIFAWIIGWALILEYAIGNVVVAISWSSYFNNLLQGIGIHLPYWLTTGYFSALESVEHINQLQKNGTEISSTMQQTVQNFASAPDFFGYKFMINLPAFLIVCLVTFVAYIGIKETKKLSNAMVILKLAVIFLVIIVGFFYVKPENWNPFMPNGIDGVLKGVSAVFFAYIGFDAISTTAEECKNPQRDLPRGMIWALIICTVLYILISFVLTGIVNYKELKVDDPLAFVFEFLHLDWMTYIISVSAVIAATSVLLVFQIGQPRIWMSMSRDGLLPKRYSTIHSKYKTPSYATIITGILVGIPALIVPSSLVTDLTSIGTLFAFVLVCLGVLALPKLRKDTKKYSLPNINSLYVMPIIVVLFFYFMFDTIKEDFIHFSLKIEHFHQNLLLIFVVVFFIISIFSMLKQWNAIPVLGALSCLYLMIEIPEISWLWFFIWMILGLIIYYFYGYKNSKIGNKV